MHKIKKELRKFLIISGGSIEDEFAKEWIAKNPADFIIVADSGMEFMRRIMMKPNMIIGDFDSVALDTLEFFKGQVDKYTWVEYGSSYLPSDINAAYLWAP